MHYGFCNRTLRDLQPRPAEELLHLNGGIMRAKRLEPFEGVYGSLQHQSLQPAIRRLHVIRDTGLSQFFQGCGDERCRHRPIRACKRLAAIELPGPVWLQYRSEEHTSELQSHLN